MCIADGKKGEGNDNATRAAVYLKVGEGETVGRGLRCCSGWRGTVKHLSQKPLVFLSVEAMRKKNKLRKALYPIPPSNQKGISKCI
jgi:hypothetical protein